MKTGDVVELKSGGPAMTVESVDDSGVLCRWFDAKNSVQQGRFSEPMLEPWESDLSAFEPEVV